MAEAEQTIYEACVLAVDGGDASDPARRMVAERMVLRTIHAIIDRTPSLRTAEELIRIVREGGVEVIECGCKDWTVVTVNDSEGHPFRAYVREEGDLKVQVDADLADMMGDKAAFLQSEWDAHVKAAAEA